MEKFDLGLEGLVDIREQYLGDTRTADRMWVSENPRFWRKRSKDWGFSVDLPNQSGSRLRGLRFWRI
ncbi:hypothetical protein SLA2020_274400 [Shorea laevis]